MSDALNTALAAVKAFQIKLDVHAHNVANGETNNFKKNRAEMIEPDRVGVQVKISQVDSPGMDLDCDYRTGMPQQSSNVLPEEEIAGQIVTRYCFSANILTIKTASAFQEEIFNIKG